jgi:hypothetical protein
MGNAREKVVRLFEFEQEGGGALLVNTEFLRESNMTASPAGPTR